MNYPYGIIPILAIIPTVNYPYGIIPILAIIPTVNYPYGIIPTELSLRSELLLR
jgi:hypothetical protein